MDEGARRGVDRITIQEAARRLGISEGAVRKRVTRGTLEHEKEDDGRIYVYLDAGDRQGVDTGQDTGVDANNSALISQLRDEVAYLRDENRRKDEIIMQQAMTMRQLSAAPPQEHHTEAAETVEEESDRVVEPHSATVEPQEGAQMPWWRKLIGRWR
jgi:exopolyphosphatase/pppGpp-phosphohydrolase